MMNFQDKNILITGGTGSLGNVLTKRLLQEECLPNKIIIFSRDEAKQHAMRLRFKNMGVATDELTYANFLQKVQFVMGDLRDYRSVRNVIRDIDIVFHVAAVKQVPAAEYFPMEAVKTNILGTSNLIDSIIESKEKVEAVIATSSDKACYPINAYGMTKSVMEKLIIAANLDAKFTRFMLTRYGNVMGSTGSVLPLFKNQIENKLPITVTTKDMTRYMMGIQQSVDLLFKAYTNGRQGDIYIPFIPSAKIIDVANIMASKTASKVIITGIRPGEKIHETLISEQEMPFTFKKDDHFIIKSMLPELYGKSDGNIKNMTTYTSQYDLMNDKELYKLLKEQGYV